MRISAVSAGMVYGTTLQNRNNVSYLPKNGLTNDVFVRSKNISFKGYDRNAVEAFITKIENGQVQETAHGYQGAYYKMNEEIGIKAPKPLFPEKPDADVKGLKNIKEYFALKRINEIDPEIAPKAFDLIERNGKNYLVTEHVQGVHPMDAKLNNEVLTDIFKKLLILDTEGIAHSDLQSGNIIITPQNKAKFIDFGSYNILTDNGIYIESDTAATELFKEGGELANQLKSNKEGRYLATYYAKSSPNVPVDNKNFSDIHYSRNRSNAGNFEFRMLYDYLKAGKEEKPVEFMKEYLKIKGKHYYEPLAAFIQSLPVEPKHVQANDLKMISKMIDAHVQLFAEPSDKIIETELNKIQMKWLLNDHTDVFKKKAYSFNRYIDNATYFNRHYPNTNTVRNFHDLSAADIYLFNIHSRIDQLTTQMYFSSNMYDIYKGDTLKPEEDIVKLVFDSPKKPAPPKTQSTVQAVTETVTETVQNTGENLKTKAKQAGKNFKKAYWAAAAVAVAAGGGIYLYQKSKAKKPQKA